MAKEYKELGGPETIDATQQSERNAIKYLINVVKEENGNYKKGVILDTNLFEGIKPRNWNRIVKDFVYNNLAGKELVVYNTGKPETIYLAKKMNELKKMVLIMRIE